jgi:hypothetical protein
MNSHGKTSPGLPDFRTIAPTWIGWPSASQPIPGEQVAISSGRQGSVRIRADQNKHPAAPVSAAHAGHCKGLAQMNLTANARCDFLRGHAADILCARPGIVIPLR